MMAGSKWESSEVLQKDRAAYFIVPRIDATKIDQERKLATDVRAELNKLGEEAEVVGHIRKYIEHLGSIHATFRKLTSAHEKQWAAAARKAMARYKATAREKTIVVVAMQTDGRRPVEEVQLFDEFFDRYAFLKRKNGTQANLSRRYVQWTGLPLPGKRA